ncbi:MAG: anthranilate synthase component I [Pseudomonadota bacterium]
MTEEQFEACIAEGYNRVPLVREVMADLDTPLSVYLKLVDEPYSYLFESVQGGEKWGRYSIIGLGCREVLSVAGHQVEIRRDGECVESSEEDDPLAFVEAYQARFKVPELPDLPRFHGGLVGYFGYESVHYIEPRLARKARAKPDPIGAPDILLMLSDELVVFDNLSGRMYLVVHAAPGEYRAAHQRLDALSKRLLEPLTPPEAGAPSRVDEEDFVSGFTRAGYESAVEQARRYIIDGDVMQVVLSQRLSLPFEAAPLDLYRALRTLNPSPYMYFLNLGDIAVVGSSPEILVRLEEGEVTVRPIAGTRKRGDTEKRDRELEAELLADPKELAEHLMLIDLGRNDAGRVSKTGTVKLTDKMVVERYSHVMHIVSNVTGELRDDLSAMDVLRATFPAGTVSGAPKIRAMEIIDELEPVKRGIYSGAVGYLGWDGNMDTAIAIRTAVIHDKTLYMQAGAGIVADSQPELEWKETMNKSRAIFRAASLAAAGFKRDD